MNSTKYLIQRRIKGNNDIHPIGFADTYEEAVEWLEKREHVKTDVGREIVWTSKRSNYSFTIHEIDKI
jgi:hypothetical protein